MSRRALARIERIGPYRIDEVIAEGATSYVLGGTYEGPSGFSQPVAVKTLRGPALRSPASVRDLVHEATAAAHVVHPGIVQVHALLEEDRLPLLVMERVHGWSLRALCATLALTRRHVPPDHAAAIVRAAALAVHALHDGGLVHNGLHPENLMVTTNGYLKVLDFGAATWESDRPCDVHALGVVLHELCGGGAPPELRAVTDRALRHHADERFATAADLAEALDDVAAHHRWRASPPSTAAYLADTFATRAHAPAVARRASSVHGRTRVRLRRV